VQVIKLKMLNLQQTFFILSDIRAFLVCQYEDAGGWILN
jgi:hypothetical protein